METQIVIQKHWNPPLEIKMLQASRNLLAIIKEYFEYIIFKNI
jgi:hypothetical protein